MNPVLTKHFNATSDVSQWHLVTFGDADYTAKAASANSEVLLGVAQDPARAGSPCLDVMLAGISDVVYGATVERGEKLTTDAQGRAIPATGAAQVVGTALEYGEVDQIGSVLLMKS